jgi:hypothetical protein
MALGRMRERRIDTQPTEIQGRDFGWGVNEE